MKMAAVKKEIGKRYKIRWKRYVEWRRKVKRFGIGMGMI